MLRLEGLTVARSRTYTCPTGKKESLKDIAQDYKWSGPWFWQLSGLGNECSLGILRQWVPKCGLRRHQDCKRKGRKKKNENYWAPLQPMEPDSLEAPAIHFNKSSWLL